MIAVVGETKIGDPVGRRVGKLATGDRRRLDSCHRLNGLEMPTERAARVVPRQRAPEKREREGRRFEMKKGVSYSYCL